MKEFKTVVFSGGGCRCLWQVGFYNTVSPELGLKPDVVAGVSAGAAMAAMIIGGASQTGLRLIKEATAVNRSNFYLSNIFSRKPAFPHYAIYRNAVLNTLDENAVKKIRSGPEVRVMFAHPPSYLGARSGAIAGLLAYTLEKHIKRPVHPVTGANLGYRATIVKLNECSTGEEMTDMIMYSSCTPPFLPVLKYKGSVTLDGGVIDNVPVRAVNDMNDKGKMLVLLTRLYDSKSIPRVKGRLYVQPSSIPPVSKWDYTNPAGLQAAYDLGRADGERFIKDYRN